MKTFELESNTSHYLAIELNNQVWSLMAKKERDQNDNKRMVAFAKGSLFHWYHSPKFTPVNAQRGHWLLSRVYTLIPMPERSLTHAQKCLALTQEHGFKGFDLAYAYEAMARAHAASGNKSSFKKYFDLAEKSGQRITDTESKNFFYSDLEAQPWFNMR